MICATVKIIVLVDAVLLALAVDVEPHAQVLRVAHLVAVTSHGPTGPKVGSPCPCPRSRRARSGRALGDVVDHAIAGDMVERLGLLDIGGALADHDAQLDFPVGLQRSFGIITGSFGPSGSSPLL
jgi:hypothetical protein